MDPGLTGLNNLGNTCFMNSALQCLSNTPQLTEYIVQDYYKKEINVDNPLGHGGFLCVCVCVGVCARAPTGKARLARLQSFPYPPPPPARLSLTTYPIFEGGIVAKRYGELIKKVWAGNAAAVAPIKFKKTMGKINEQYAGAQQQDSQEFLAYLLDGLHEDLNRIVDKPYTNNPDSDGRPDAEIADICWENYKLRNQSIIVDLFTGQLKSTVICSTCHNASVKFEEFTSLSLPLPVDTDMAVDVILIRRDGRSVLYCAVLC